jgi:hypothetical protein
MENDNKPLNIEESLKLITDTINEAKIIKDPEVWQMAKRRAAFKTSIFLYPAISCLLVGIWYFTSGAGTYFWPKFPMLCLGFALAVQYVHAYHGRGVVSVHKEYDKLMESKNKKINTQL